MEVLEQIIIRSDMPLESYEMPRHICKTHNSCVTCALAFRPMGPCLETPKRSSPSGVRSYGFCQPI